MPNQVTISTVNGSPNFDIYVCNSLLLNCVYVTTINLSQLPYSFIVPFPYNNLNTIYVKIIDSNGCVINHLLYF